MLQVPMGGSGLNLSVTDQSFVMGVGGFRSACVDAGGSNLWQCDDVGEA